MTTATATIIRHIRRYNILKMDDWVETVLKRSIDQLPSIKKIPKEILNEYLIKKKPLMLMLKEERYYGKLLWAGENSIEVEVKDPPPLTKNDRVLIIIDHPSLKKYNVLQVRQEKKLQNRMVFIVDDPRFDKRFALPFDVPVSLYPVPKPIIQKLDSQELSLVREFVWDGGRTDVVCNGYLDYFTNYVEFFTEGADKFRIKSIVDPYHDKILHQKPLTGMLKDISQGGVCISWDKLDTPHNTFFFVLQLPGRKNEGDLTIRLLGHNRGIRPAYDGTVNLSAAFFKRIKDQYLSEHLTMLSLAETGKQET
ncbi:MAG: hypothetical protein HQK59_10295 [Deltaproteobacteria bacterium]|nr:hypothetical protein [Deltaproteobacteria bacterium]